MANGENLFELVATDLLDIAVVEETHIDIALGALANENLAHLAELEFTVGIATQFSLLLFHLRA